MPEPIKIIIADSQYLIREGLKSLFATKKDILIVGETANKHDLFYTIHKQKPDIIILDYNNQEGFSIDDLQILNTAGTNIKILIIADISHKESVHRAVEYGVTGFLTKTCDSAEIIEAIYCLMRNEKMYCHKVLDIILEQPVQYPQNCEPAILSEREIEIIKLICSGYTSREIAENLFRSFHTISTHRKNIMKKLGIKSTSELILYAMNTGMIQPATQSAG